MGHEEMGAPRIVVGITGASGASYARRLVALRPGEKHVIFSKWGKRVFEEETGLPATGATLGISEKALHSDEDLLSPLASGTNRVDGVVIIPCSTSTLGKIASGRADTLLTRVSAVALRDTKKLVLCIRETPLSTIMLKNALLLAEAGATILPLCPPFYFRPTSVEELVDGMVHRILGFLGFPHGRGYRGNELD